MKRVVITGVSTGIGRGTALELVRRGFHVFGSVRDKEDARELEGETGRLFTPLLFDVTDPQAVREAADQVREATGPGGVMGLVNNAGIAVAGPLMHVPIDRARSQFEVNVLGLLNVTQAFLPLLMGKDPRASGEQPSRARIINISSVSGVVPYPFLGLYAASKHAVESLSRVLRSELLPYDIDVIVIEPGDVRTPIWEKRPDETLYEHTDYAPMLKRLEDHITRSRPKAMPVSVVSRVIYKALTAKKPKPRYVVNANKLSRRLLIPLLPDKWLDLLVAGAVGLRK